MTSRAKGSDADTSSGRQAAVGVVEHGNSVVLVTLSNEGELLDRRRVDLTDGLPTHPYHHQGSWAVGRYKNSPWARDISLADAIALVERVQKAASSGARQCLADLDHDVPETIVRVALRVCPDLPSSIEARIADNQAQTMADSVMYRRAVADAAVERGWSVSWYDRARVFDDASAASGRTDIDGFILAIGRPAGPPWKAQQKLAAAAALAAFRYD